MFDLKACSAFRFRRGYSVAAVSCGACSCQSGRAACCARNAVAGITRSARPPDARCCAPQFGGAGIRADGGGSCRQAAAAAPGLSAKEDGEMMARSNGPMMAKIGASGSEHQCLISSPADQQPRLKRSWRWTASSPACPCPARDEQLSTPRSSRLPLSLLRGHRCAC